MLCDLCKCYIMALDLLSLISFISVKLYGFGTLGPLNVEELSK